MDLTSQFCTAQGLGLLQYSSLIICYFLSMFPRMIQDVIALLILPQTTRLRATESHKIKKRMFYKKIRQQKKEKDRSVLTAGDMHCKRKKHS